MAGLGFWWRWRDHLGIEDSVMEGLHSEPRRVILVPPKGLRLSRRHQSLSAGGQESTCTYSKTSDEDVNRVRVWYIDDIVGGRSDLERRG